LTKIKPENFAHRHLIHVSDSVCRLRDHIGMVIIKKINVHIAASVHDTASLISPVVRSLPR